MVGIGEKEWREHAELLGQVTLGWNQTVFKLLQIFVHLTGIGGPIADAIFFSHQSDRAQRGLIARTAKAVAVGEDDLKRLEMLLGRLDKIATQRNLATHTIFGLSMFDPETHQWGPTVVPALTPAQDKRLEKDFASQFRRLDRDLSVILRDLEDWLLHTPFPKRAWGTPVFHGEVPGRPPVPDGPQLDDALVGGGGAEARAEFES
jgi:hypothetical protein